MGTVAGDEPMESKEHFARSLNYTPRKMWVVFSSVVLECRREKNMMYVGLTDDPQERKKAHGSPSDWSPRSFSTEREARNWEKEMLGKPGYQGGPGGKGWRYGYTYTITSSTRENV
jgi:hypothetical protein